MKVGSILNVYAFNSRVSNYMGQKLVVLQEEIDESITIAGNFTLPRNGQVHQGEN